MTKRKAVASSSPGMLRAVKALEKHGPMDGHEIADKACVSFSYFQNQCRHVLTAEGKIHLHEYRHNSRGPFVQVYAAGPAVGDPPTKPEKIDQLARSRNWKERTGYNALRKAQRRLANPKRVEPVLAALTAANPAQRSAA